VPGPEKEKHSTHGQLSGCGVEMSHFPFSFVTLDLVKV